MLLGLLQAGQKLNLSESLTWSYEHYLEAGMRYLVLVLRHLGYRSPLRQRFLQEIACLVLIGLPRPSYRKFEPRHSTPQGSVYLENRSEPMATNSRLFTFSLPDPTKPLGLASCACVLVKGCKGDGITLARLSMFFK